MTLLLMDSFDYFSAGTTPSTAELSAFNYFNISGSATCITGPFGGVAMASRGDGGGGAQPSTAFDLVHPNFSAGISAETIIGQRIWAYGNSSGRFYVKNSSAGTIFSVGVNSYGQVVVYNYDNSIKAISRPGTVNTQTWNYFEIRFTLNTRIRVRVNTDLVIDYVGTFGPPSNPTTWDVLSWGGAMSFTTQQVFAWDDLYVLTTTAAPNNDYLGNVRVRLQQPAAAGDVTQLTPVGAASNYLAQINPTLSAGVYDQTATVGQYDLYQMQANAAARNIYGVQVRGTFLQDNATQLKGSLVMKTGGTEYEGTHYSLSSAYDTYYSVWDINPHTSAAWTNSDLNAIQAGPKLAESA